MTCPYCGKEIQGVPHREHYFPQSVCSNNWDFYVCETCNKIKREHIVYPSPELFMVYPREFSMEKFTDLWKRASFEKYLHIVPAARMHQSFIEGRWIPGALNFTIPERQFYKLDEFKEIYHWANKLMTEDLNIQGLVMSTTIYRFWLLHTYTVPYITPYACVQGINVHEFVNSRRKGILICGNSSNYVWKVIPVYKQHFQNLLNMPSSFEMLFQ